MAKFWESGYVQYNMRLGENPVVNEPVAVLGQVVMERALKKYKFNPYNIQLLQEMYADDFDWRLHIF